MRHVKSNITNSEWQINVTGTIWKMQYDKCNVTIQLQHVKGNVTEPTLQMLFRNGLKKNPLDWNSFNSRRKKSNDTLIIFYKVTRTWMKAYLHLYERLKLKNL